MPPASVLRDQRPSRRSLTKGVAWTVPVVALGAAAPAFASSGTAACANCTARVPQTITGSGGSGTGCGGQHCYQDWKVSTRTNSSNAFSGVGVAQTCMTASDQITAISFYFLAPSMIVWEYDPTVTGAVKTWSIPVASTDLDGQSGSTNSCGSTYSITGSTYTSAAGSAMTVFKTTYTGVPLTVGGGLTACTTDSYRVTDLSAFRAGPLTGVGSTNCTSMGSHALWDANIFVGTAIQKTWTVATISTASGTCRVQSTSGCGTQPYTSSGCAP